MSATTIRKAIARLRSEEKALRAGPARHARQALAYVRRSRFFLAVSELIEAEVAHHEAEAVKRAVKTMGGLR